jgi:5-methylcytosine-specific restriction enzyme subunit McrC
VFEVQAAAQIPIQNLYYLFLYAWNCFQQGKTIDVSGIKSPGLVNLFAKVLHDAINQVKRRGLDRGYVEHAEDLATIRGRILVGPTIGRVLQRRARVFCEFDELSIDVLHNQILKSTMLQLVATEGLDEENTKGLRTLIETFSEVTPIRLSTASFRRVQVHGNNAFYNLALKVCALVHDVLLPTKRGRGFRFRDVLDDEIRMSKVFEDFVFNFFRLEQIRYTPKSPTRNYNHIKSVGYGHCQDRQNSSLAASKATEFCRFATFIPIEPIRERSASY